MNGGAISWKSSKKTTNANLTTEVEYISPSDAAKEALWLKKFIADLGVIPSISDPIPLLCNKNGAIAQVKEPRSHQKSKHILRRFHLIDRGDVVMERVPSTDNVADPLTKPLAQEFFERHCICMSLMYQHDWL